jgi:hypothetical protein
MGNSFSTTSASSQTWLSDVVDILRVLIDDPTGATYSDARLEDIGIIAAHFVAKEVIFSSDYTIDIVEQSADPTPDADFKNLAALRAAMIVLSAEAKSMANNAIKVVDGPSSIEIGRGLSYIKALADHAANEYAVQKASYQAGWGRVILTPFTSEGIDPATPF